MPACRFSSFYRSGLSGNAPSLCVKAEYEKVSLVGEPKEVGYQSNAGFVFIEETGGKVSITLNSFAQNRSLV